MGPVTKHACEFLELQSKYSGSLLRSQQRQNFQDAGPKAQITAQGGGYEVQKAAKSQRREWTKFGKQSAISKPGRNETGRTSLESHGHA